jgi:hypothetical protein
LLYNPVKDEFPEEKKNSKEENSDEISEESNSQAILEKTSQEDSNSE